MFGVTIIKESELPFHREVHRLIKKHPEYLTGIRLGTVHLAWNPRRKLSAASTAICRRGMDKNE